jgi:hypothetical protein
MRAEIANHGKLSCFKRIDLMPYLLNIIEVIVFCPVKQKLRYQKKNKQKRDTEDTRGQRTYTQMLMDNMDPTDVGGVDLGNMTIMPERERMANVSPTSVYTSALLCNCIVLILLV